VLELAPRGRALGEREALVVVHLDLRELAPQVLDGHGPDGLLEEAVRLELVQRVAARGLVELLEVVRELPDLLACGRARRGREASFKTSRTTRWHTPARFRAAFRRSPGASLKSLCQKVLRKRFAWKA